MHKFNRTIVVGTVALALSVASCSTKGGNSAQQKTDNSGVKTDYGVTDKDITLGALTDQSGVFKAQGLAYTAANQIWADEVSAKGGICGRQIKINVQDTAYQADKAVTLYASIKDKVAGIVQVAGSPALAAIKQSIVSDHMLSVPAAWASTNLDVPEVFMVGATYDIEIINGLAYLQDNGLIKDGDKIGHLYIDSEYGNSAALGSEAYAKKHNQTIVPAKVTSTDVDMTPAITQFKSVGVKAVVVTTTPAQTGSAVTSMAAQGMGDLPVLGNNPSFSPPILGTPAKDALGNYYRAVSWAPYSADKPTVQAMAKAYEAKHTDLPSDSVVFGYASGLAFQSVLEAACKAKDLTRAGIVKAAKAVKVDMKGLTGPLDFSDPGQPSTRSTYIEQADPNAKGGLKIVQELTESTEAKSYKTPLQK